MDLKALKNRANQLYEDLNRSGGNDAIPNTTIAMINDFINEIKKIFPNEDSIKNYPVLGHTIPHYSEALVMVGQIKAFLENKEKESWKKIKIPEAGIWST